MTTITAKQAQQITDHLNTYEQFAREYHDDEEYTSEDRCLYGIDRALDILRILHIPFTQDADGNITVSA